jgi:hypothetical protein
MRPLLPVCNPPCRSRYLAALLAALGSILCLRGAPDAAAAPAPRRNPPRRSAAPPRPARPPTAAPRPAPSPPVATPAAPAPTQLTTTALGHLLRVAGYEPRVEGEVHRLRVEEQEYAYLLDVSLSRSGAWLLCAAHLAPIPDLTRVPPGPLLALLSANDALVGMYFSYNRSEGQVMLNATLRNRGLDAADLRAVIEGMKDTIRERHGLWDARHWAGPGG